MKTLKAKLPRRYHKKIFCGFKLGNFFKNKKPEPLIMKEIVENWTLLKM
jgi:hypothetical protein